MVCLKTEMKINGKHILRTFGWIIFALFLVIIGIGGLLYFKAESYINHNLSEFVAKKSDNKYQLSFHNIEFNYKPFSISVSNISFIDWDNCL